MEIFLSVEWGPLPESSAESRSVASKLASDCGDLHSFQTRRISSLNPQSSGYCCALRMRCNTANIFPFRRQADQPRWSIRRPQASRRAAHASASPAPRRPGEMQLWPSSPTHAQAPPASAQDRIDACSVRVTETSKTWVSSSQTGAACPCDAFLDRLCSRRAVSGRRVVRLSLEEKAARQFGFKVRHRETGESLGLRSNLDSNGIRTASTGDDDENHFFV